MYEADLNSDDQVQEKDDEIHQTQEIGQPGNTNYDNTKEIISKFIKYTFLTKTLVIEVTNQMI